MPGGLSSLLFNFLATHLVVICLAVFAVSGVYLMRAGEDIFADDKTTSAVESVSQKAEPKPSLALAQPSTAGEGSSGVPETRPPGLDAGRPPMPQTVVNDRPPPRMIGGSLPIHGEQVSIPGMPFRPADPNTFGQPAALPPTRDELVQRARRAFWNGDFEGAEVAYMDLISVFPEDADAFGELGNLYQSMGRNAEAMDAYFEAGVRLKAAGDQEKLSQIIELFEKEGDERIEQLVP